MSRVSLFEAARLLLTYDDYVILIHEHADGDAVGSAEALRKALQTVGKRAAVFCPDETLPGDLTSFVGAPLSHSLEGKRAFVSVDVAELHLLGGYAKELDGKILLKIDHHLTGEDFARFNYTDPEAAAAGEIIYELLDLMDIHDRSISESVYVAIASDTGCFRFSNTTAKTLSIAAKLYEDGIDAAELNRLLYENKDLKTVKATALGIEKAEFFLDGQAAICCFDNAMRALGPYKDEHLAGLSSALREIAGVEVTAVLKQDENDPERFRLSTRSKRSFDCSALCRTFDGGGHLRASGGEVRANSPQEAVKKVKNGILKLWKS